MSTQKPWQDDANLRVAVLGAGSFGTALAQLSAERGHETCLWSRRPEHAAAMATERCNSDYLPDFSLHEGMSFTADLAEATRGKQLILAVVPSQVTRSVLAQVSGDLSPDAVVVCASKGIEEGSLQRMDQVLAEVLPPPLAARAAYLSGPSFARELMERHPTAVSIAAHDEVIARGVQAALKSPVLRAYTSDDIVGLEIGGAVKNIIAIACGIADGLEFGHNTRAAIITRGLAEITRLGATLGANPLTFLGLAGMGDLVLTCTGGLSRNRSVGLAIGRGETLTDILARTRQIAEGVRTTASTRALSHSLGVEMPIVEQVFEVLYRDKPPRRAVVDLMTRAPKPELEP